MTKKNLILGGVLAALIVAAFLYQGPYKNWQKNNEKPDNFLAGINFANVSKIEIVKGENTTVLEQKDDKWLIKGTKGFFVKPEIMNEVKTSIEEANNAKVILVSSNTDNKANFHVDDKLGTKVKLMNGEEVLANFIIGKATKDYLGTYIAETGSAKTYSIAVTLDRTFVRDDWHNMEILTFDKEKINKIRFQYGDKGFTIEKNKDGWVGLVPFKFRVDDKKVAPILDIMSNLSATEIPAQTFEGTGLEKNSIIVQAMGEGIDQTIMIGDANDQGLYFAKKGDSDNIYLITKEQRDALKIGYRDLR